MSCSVFIQTPTPLLAIKRSCRAWPIESCVTSVYRSWSWTFFNSCSDIALEVAFWYRFIGKTLLTSKNGNAHATKRLCSSMNSASYQRETVWRFKHNTCHFAFLSEKKNTWITVQSLLVSIVLDNVIIRCASKWFIPTFKKKKIQNLR